MSVPTSHRLHGAISHDVLRQWQSAGTHIAPIDLMLPLFIIDSEDGLEPVSSLPGVSRHGYKSVIAFLTPLVNKGLKSIILFGVPRNLPKDDVGSSADSESTPVILALHTIVSTFPSLLVACDVCLCAYTDHGHCGLLYPDGSINNDASIKRIAQVATSYAKAGAHVVAPSDMMDGRIGAIKESLVAAQLSHKTSVLSYSVKFASAFYGPFRDAADSAPKSCSRATYQLPPGSRGIGMRAADRDVKEGADMLMVKPGLAYLDIVRDVKNKYPQYPLFIYQVSGEYAMLHHGASAGAFKLQTAVMECLTSMKRAGADVIMTYFTPQILDWLQQST